MKICQNQADDKLNRYHDSKVHGANMGPTWGRQDPGQPHVGHMNLAIWVVKTILQQFSTYILQSKELSDDIISRYETSEESAMNADSFHHLTTFFNHRYYVLRRVPGNSLHTNILA